MSYNSQITITDADGAVDELAGELHTSRNLLAKLIDDIEDAQDVAREMKDDPTRMSRDAVEARLKSLWTLAEVLDQRLKQHLELTDALINGRPERPLKQAA